MIRQRISSGSPFETQAGYSRAVSDGEWCWVAGTTGYAADRSMPENVGEQTRNAFATIEAALGEAGFALSDVVRATYYIADAALWAEVAPVLGEVFANVRPAATCIVCGLIAPEMKVEIEVTARKRS